MKIVLTDILKRIFYAKRPPTDQSGHAAYADGFEKAEDNAENPFRKGSRLYTCWKRGRKDGRTNVMQQY